MSKPNQPLAPAQKDQLTDTLQPVLALSETGAAAALSISKRTLFDLRKSGKIGYVTAGTRITYPVECLVEYLRSNQKGGA